MQKIARIFLKRTPQNSREQPNLQKKKSKSVLKYSTKKFPDNPKKNSTKQIKN